MESSTLRPSVRSVTILFAVAVAVSLVHYLDNTISYADYPAPASDSALAPVAPSQLLVGLSWFAFTGAGLWGLSALRRGRDRRAAVGLALYSGSGLVGFLHYAVPGALDMPWWRHAHVVADIACGLAIFAVALTVATRPGRA